MKSIRRSTAFLASITAASLALSSCGGDKKLQELDEQVHKLYEQEQYAEATKAAETALAEAERRFSPDREVELIVPLNNLAGLYRLSGRPADAASIYRRMIEIYEAEAASEDDRLLTYHDLATVSLETSDFKTAAQYEGLVLEIKERRISEGKEGASAVDLAPTLNNLGYVLLAQGNAAEAEPLLLRAATLVEENLGPGHPYYDISLSHLADLYRLAQRWEKAERILKRLIEVRAGRLGAGSPEVARGWNNLGVLYKDSGRLVEAEKAYRTALEFFGNSAGQYPADEQIVRANLDEALSLAGKKPPAPDSSQPSAQ